MIINTKEFKAASDAILVALTADKNAANLEIKAKDNNLFLSVTNKEFYVCCKYETEQVADFRAVVNAQAFLSLISGITAETFALEMHENYITVKVGKSNYKFAMIYENDALMTLPVIKLENTTVNMVIGSDILASIMNINGKEVQKAKIMCQNEITRLYFIDETGCFTLSNSACFNAFTLEQPVKLLLNDRIIKLFKLFNGDVDFSFGYDELANGTIQTKIIMQTNEVYVAALINCEDALINKMIGPCAATKQYINTAYDVKAVVSVNELSAAISRFMQFTKNSTALANSNNIVATISYTTDGLVISDDFENTEYVPIENGSYIPTDYVTKINLVDLKYAIDFYKNEHITINCGNRRTTVVNHGAVNYVISEGN